MIERSCELREVKFIIMIFKNLLKPIIILFSKALDNMATADRDLRRWELTEEEWTYK